MAAAVGIGREDELQRLIAAARQAIEGHGSVAFLAGPTGSGKSFLLKTFAEGLDPATDFVSVLCYETGADNPLGPFTEALRALTNEERRGDRAKRIFELLGKVAPPLLELVPGVGTLAGKVVKAGTDVGVYALGGSHEEQQKELAADVALVLQHAAHETPLVVVVDDAHWIDAASTQVIARLSEAAAEHALLLIVAYDPDLLGATHPLALVRADSVGHGRAFDVPLADLTTDGVEAFLRDRYGTVPGPRLAEWLHDRTDGNLLFLEQYLARLEEGEVLRREGDVWTLDGTIEGEPEGWSLGGRLKDAQTPGNLLELLRPRVAELEDDERALLETAAVQGRRFLSW